MYTGIVVIAAGCLTLFLWNAPDGSGVRAATFQTLSILTTTGFASVDFELWTDQAKVILLALMFIGGCAGRLSGRWPKGASACPGRPLYVARTPSHHAPSRRAAGQARWQGGAGRDHASGTRVLSVLHPDVRGVCGGGHRSWRRYGDRVQRDDRDSGQHRTRLVLGGTDGELCASTRCEQDTSDAGDVDRPVGGVDGARTAPARSVAVGPLEWGQSGSSFM